MVGESLQGTRDFVASQSASSIGPPPRRPALPRPAAADEFGTLRGLDPSGLLRSLNLGTDELLHFLALALGTPDASFGFLFIF